jgi:hypothetical protein
MASRQEMAAEAKEIVDQAMSRKKSLDLPWRFEATHVAFSSPRRLMRDFGSIIRTAVLAMGNTGQQLSVCDSIAGQLISPQFVEPYVKGNKNDSRDAEAICEAVSRPHMRFVPLKTVESQGIQAIHRMRSRLIKERTALGNQVRGLLAERGIVLAQGITRLRQPD